MKYWFTMQPISQSDGCQGDDEPTEILAYHSEDFNVQRAIRVAVCFQKIVGEPVRLYESTTERSWDILDDTVVWEQGFTRALNKPVI